MSQTSVLAVGTEAPEEVFRASVKMAAGVATVTFRGRLGPPAIPACRSALDSVVRVRAPRMVLNLSGAKLDHDSVAVLTWIHRQVSHFGVSLTLIGVNHQVLPMLKPDHLDALVQNRPTDPAQRRATARAERRTQWTQR